MNNKTYDYIIVGSGPSGGNLAYNLSKAGAKCLMIEAGKFFRKDTFPKSEADNSAQLYWGGGIELEDTARMAFIRAKAVGGTSIVNQCLLDRFDDIAFNDWQTASGVNFFNTSEMAPYYDQVEDFLDLHTFTESERGKNAVLFCKACDQLGIKWNYLRKGQNDCAHEQGNDCIECLGGCFRDSKQSSLATYIQAAEKHGLEVSSETEVHQIEHTSDIVKVNAIKDNQKITFKGKNLILAGGSFGTTKLLIQSGYKSTFSALGKYFSSHPQFMFVGLFDDIVDSHKGYFQTVASKDPKFRKQGFKLENVFAPPIAFAMLFNTPGFRHQEIMRNYRHLSCIEVAIRDDNNGTIDVNKKGKLIIKKPLTDQDKVKRDKGWQVLRDILNAEGAKRVIESPYYFGLHLMGGCAIGTDEKHAVVNPDFNLYGTKNIYIADSSIYPNAPGINPSLTIFALSQKLSNQLTNNAYVTDTQSVSAESAE